MKDFIPYEEALALKELGFDEECLDGYNKYGKLWGMRFDNQSTVNDACSAPLFSQAFRFFREKYDLFISIMHYENGYSINDLRRFDTHEEAELACLKKLIQIVKQKQ
jgi:hypothetical protein